MTDSFPLPSRAQRQRGFTLIELSIVLVLMAMAITTLFQIQREQLLGNTSLAVAQSYQRMNKAVSGYMQTYYSVLTDETRIRPECSNPYWLAGSTGSARSNGCRLALQINGGAVVQVDNGLQPTPRELAQLGFLSGGNNYNDVLPLPTLTDGNPSLAFTPGDFLVRDIAGAIIPRYMVVIQNICINGGSVNVVSVTGSCTTGSKDLRSWVFNSQPFLESQTSSTTVLDRALEYLGADGYLSGPADPANPNASELRSLAKSPEPLQGNFTRTATGVGAPYILAVRSGYGSADWSLFKKQVTDLANTVGTLSGNLSALSSTVVNNYNFLNGRINDTNASIDSKVKTAIDAYDFKTKITEVLKTVDLSASIAAGSEYVQLKIHPCYVGDLEITYNTFLNKTKKEQFITASGSNCEFKSTGAGQGWVITDLPYDAWMPVLVEFYGAIGNDFRTGRIWRNNRWVWAIYSWGQQNGGWLQYSHIRFVRTGTDTTQTDGIEAVRCCTNPGVIYTDQLWKATDRW